jgi:hypothetical protein
VNSTAACNIFPSSADLAPSLRFPSYVKPEIMERLNLRNGKHPDAIIKDFKPLLDNKRYVTHRVAIYRGT